jgi:hypothetical protein
MRIFALAAATAAGERAFERAVAAASRSASPDASPSTTTRVDIATAASGGAPRTCRTELQSDFAAADGLDEQLEVPSASVPMAIIPMISLPDNRPVRTLPFSLTAALCLFVALTR